MCPCSLALIAVVACCLGALGSLPALARLLRELGLVGKLIQFVFLISRGALAHGFFGISLPGTGR